MAPLERPPNQQMQRNQARGRLMSPSEMRSSCWTGGASPSWNEAMRSLEMAGLLWRVTGSWRGFRSAAFLGISAKERGLDAALWCRQVPLAPLVAAAGREVSLHHSMEIRV